MPNRNYERGRRHEWALRDDLREAGYDCVARTAGSKTKIDLIAVAKNVILFVQAKADGKISPAERQQLLHLAGLNPGVTIPVLGTKEGFFLLTGPGPRDRTLIDVAALREDASD